MSSNTSKEQQRCGRERLLLGALYLVGIAHWIGFFYLVHPEGGDGSFVKGPALSGPLLVYRSFKAHDWVKETQLLHVLQDALRTQTIPLHSPELRRLVAVPEGEGGNRFLAFPAIPRSPQIVLLYALDPVTFVFVNLLLMYSLGFYGCLLLRRHYNLGLIPFVFLFLLFNLNGYFIEKFTVYGAGLLGYFLLPFVVLLMFRVSEAHQTDGIGQARNGAVLGLVLAGIQYQGSFYIFLASITFVLIWGVVNYKLWRVTLISLLTAFAVAAVILLPAAITYGVGKNPHSVWGGYSRPELYVEALVVTRENLCDRFIWHEFSLYVGLAGLLALIYFGLWGPFMRFEWVRFRGWRAMAVPCLALVFMSFRHWKHYLIPDWIPLLNAVSLTTRYMIVPLIVVAAIAAVNLQGFIEKYWDRRRVRWAIVLGLAALAISLFNHSRVWRMQRVHGEYDTVVKQGLCGEPVDPAWQVVLRIENNMADTFYIISFWVGLVISLITVGVIAGWWGYRWQWQSRRRLNA